MGRALTIFFGLLAFGLLVWVCLGHREGIQKEIADNARAALVADGHGFARASADGQTVVLQGTANTAEQRDAAGRTAAAVPGVVAVDNQIALLAEVPPPGPTSKPMIETEVGATPGPVSEPEPESDPVALDPVIESLQIQLDGDAKSAMVSGTTLITSAAEADATPKRFDTVSESITAALPDWQIESELSQGADQPAELVVAVQQVLPTLAGAKRAQLEADVDGIRIEADLASFSQRSALEATLSELNEQEDFATSNLTWLLNSPSANVERCQTAFDELLGADSIQFTTNRAEIRPGSIGLLDKLVEVATGCEVSIEIEGHTDSRGSVALNKALSQARADTVRSYLIDNGVGAARINARGLGSERPIADNNTINGRQANRRIEFRVQRTAP